MENIQEIYINLDDSGKLSNKEIVCVYGGIIFTSKKQKDKFITQYKSIINDIKCHYCKVCNKVCPEIKNTNIKKSDKRRVMNYLKKYSICALVIKNENVYDYIKNNKAAKGRFIDYSIRRLIKEIINKLIIEKVINPNLPLNVIINMDQQTTKSNGYYNLRDGIIEELKYGIVNYNYSNYINPIVFSDLNVTLTYQDSKSSYVVQTADLLAGSIRNLALQNLENLQKNISSFTKYCIIIP
jgi:NAD-dependent dihydropyrimidine dehydrogenase PreA subunit